jgi:glycosyltransferase involved in cell wall biosynthesis
MPMPSREPKPQVRVLYITTGLSTGGAETALLGLLSRFTTTKSMVVSMIPIEGAVVADKIKALGIPVLSLGLSRSIPNPLAVLHLRRIVNDFKPDIIHGWMYHGCLMASLASRSTPVLWSIRQSLYDLSSERLPTRVVIRLCAFGSRRPTQIVYNGELALKQHEALGFSPRHHRVILNGFDTDRFRPNPEARRRVRAELGVSEDTVLIGLIGRYHPMKDHPNFFAAAARVAVQCHPAHFLLAGKDVTGDNPEIVPMIASGNLSSRVTLLGPRTDIPDINAALDVACSSSFSEGFSNTIAEGMSCGVPCVATDVGEARLLIAETGVIVPPRDSSALAEALIHLVEAGAPTREQLGHAARSRVESKFPLSLAATSHEQMYQEIVSSRRA